jgi:hemerythrin
MSSPAVALALHHIGEQHSRLLDLFHQLSNVAMLPDGPASAMDLLEELRDLLLAHFRDEDRFMEGIGYPELAGHKWQHELLATDLIHIVAAANRRGRRLSVDDLQKLRVIIQEHADEADADFIAFCTDRFGATEPGGTADTGR